MYGSSSACLNSTRFKLVDLALDTFSPLVHQPITIMALSLTAAIAAIALLDVSDDWIFSHTLLELSYILMSVVGDVKFAFNPPSTTTRQEFGIKSVAK